MPHLNMANANKVQEALQKASNLLPIASPARLDIVEAIGILTQAKDMMADGALRVAADIRYGTDDVEIDDEVATSPGDGGTWVAAWVWMAEPDEPEAEHDHECDAFYGTCSCDKGEG